MNTDRALDNWALERLTVKRVFRFYWRISLQSRYYNLFRSAYRLKSIVDTKDVWVDV